MSATGVSASGDARFALEQPPLREGYLDDVSAPPGGQAFAVVYSSDSQGTQSRGAIERYVPCR